MCTFAFINVDAISMTEFLLIKYLLMLKTSRGKAHTIYRIPVSYGEILEYFTVKDKSNHKI
jgi:hypothetical protein